MWGDILWWFWFAFIWKFVMLRTCLNASAYFCIFFGEMSIQVLCQFLIWVIHLLLWVKELPYIFWSSVPNIPEKGMAVHAIILVWRILVDGGAWWATVHGVAQSQTWLKWLSNPHKHGLQIFPPISFAF